jgi:aminoglycoside phosphotransferase (APT) family kinase protein
VDTRVARWLTEVLGSGFAPVRSLSFGITSELELVEADGARFVLRRYTDGERAAQHPGLVDDEVRALEAARDVLGDLVPRPVAWDPSGAAAGVPALLMTYLPGTAQIHGLDPVTLVEPLTRLHAAPLSSGLPPYRSWLRRSDARVPEWSARPEAWTRLVEWAAAPEPPASESFLHRDFHPGNLLWQDGRLSGIVDWAEACRGPKAVDLAHTRCNLALVDGAEAAEQFLLEYVRVNPSYRHDPWWDAAELLTWVDDFSGVLAFNAFGAELDLALVRARADEYAGAVSRRATIAR